MTPAAMPLTASELVMLGGTTIVVVLSIVVPLMLLRRRVVEPPDQAVARLDAQLLATRALLRAVFENTLDGVLLLDPIRDDAESIVDFRFRQANAAAVRIIGRDEAHLLGQSVLEAMPCLRGTGLFGAVASVLQSSLPLESRSYHSRDTGEWFQIGAVRVGAGLVVTVTDVTRRRLAEEQLRHAALHDGLTGLPNRAAFADCLAAAIQRSRRSDGHRYAVLFLDFDRFKIINDSLGHDVGDGLLQSIADRLRGNLRGLDVPSLATDGILPARIGGDEFLVLLEGTGPGFDPIAVADRLQEALSRPHVVYGHEVVSTASIGIVTSAGGYDSPETIIRHADAAMYRSKQAGKARNTVFDDEMRGEDERRAAFESDLRGAAERGEFSLAYQPVVRLDTREIVGAEALLRWHHPTRGTVFASELIGPLEELALMPMVGRRVVASAVRQLGEWRERFPRLPLRMTINVSRSQLVDPDLPETVLSALDAAGLDGSSLILEIAEREVTGANAILLQALGAVRATGVALGMDDFGTGPVSIGDLRDLPLRSLKLDRSLIVEPHRLREVASVVHAVLDLADSLGIDVVAEGIEDQDHLTLLLALGCHYGQGHFFGKVDTVEAFESLLETAHRGAA